MKKLKVPKQVSKFLNPKLSQEHFKKIVPNPKGKRVSQVVVGIGSVYIIYEDIKPEPKIKNIG